MIQLLYPNDGETVCLQTEEQAQFLRDEQKRAKRDGQLAFSWDKLVEQGTDRTLPNPVVLSWQESEDDACSGSFYLLVSERKDLQLPLVYVTDATCLEIYNLKVGTQYFWCVQKDGKRSEVHTFYTADAVPRCLKIDHISNVRDMGGYAVEEGTIRQGLVYRGGEFESHMHLSEAGARELLRLGVRTELDMRGEAKGLVDFTTAQAIGIERVYIPSVPYAHVFKQENANAVQAFFKVFCDPKNYPIYYHCWGGADRTGTFAFILGAFLGMCMQDLINEYEFTSLSIWGIRTRNYGEFHNFLEVFQALKGNSLQQKAATYLAEYAGLTQEEMATIREILIETDM